MSQSTIPRVFVSAASSDLRSARSVVNEALTRIECLPIEESVFGTEYGAVREMLQRKIGSCQAVIHLVGRDYGGEPDPRTLPNGQPRRSWTQIEYDLARQQNKKLYVIVCDDGYPFDPAVMPEPDEKRSLQDAHRAAVLADDHLWHMVQDRDELREQIENLKVPLDEVREELRRQQFRYRLQTGFAAAAIVLVLTVVVYGLSQLRKKVDKTSGRVADVGVGVQDVGTKLDAVPGQIDAAKQETVRQLSDPAALAATIRQKIESTAEQKIAALPDEKGRWQKVAEVEQQRDAALGRVDDLIWLTQEVLKEGASPVSVHATEILEKEGIDAALAYLEKRRLATLDIGRRHAARAEAEKQQRNETLQPLLLEANLLETKLDWQRALELREQVARLAPDWFEARNYLGKLLHELARFRDAEPHLRAALALAGDPKEKAAALNNSAQLLQATDRLAEAETLMRGALDIAEQLYGVEHPGIATELNNLAQLLQATGRPAEAEPLIRRALTILEQQDGAESSEVAVALNNLAQLLQSTNRLTEAELFYCRALAIDLQAHGPDHPKVAIRLNNLGSFFWATNRVAEAEPLLRRALAIDEQSFGTKHPNVAVRLNNLTSVLKATNRVTEAEPLIRRALVIDEHSYGTAHPTVATDLNTLVQVLQATNRWAEAPSLYRRVVKILENPGGEPHPNYAGALNNLAQVLRSRDRLTDAEPLMRRALGVVAARHAEDHPNTLTLQENYRVLLAAMDIPPEEIEQRVRRAMESPETLSLTTSASEQLRDPTAAVNDVLKALDHQDKAEGKPAVYSLPIEQPIAPHLDEVLGQSTLDVPLDQPIHPHLEKLLGPTKSVSEVLADLDRQYRGQNKPDAWFLPLDEPISPHLDGLLGPLPEDRTESAAFAPNRNAARSDPPLGSVRKLAPHPALSPAIRCAAGERGLEESLRDQVFLFSDRA